MEEFRQGKIDFDVLYEEPSLFGEAGMEPEAGTGEIGLTDETVDVEAADDEEDDEMEVETEVEEAQPEPET
jgi:hypothetical protein